MNLQFNKKFKHKKRKSTFFFYVVFLFSLLLVISVLYFFRKDLLEFYKSKFEKKKEKTLVIEVEKRKVSALELRNLVEKNFILDVEREKIEGSENIILYRINDPRGILEIFNDLKTFFDENGVIINDYEETYAKGEKCLLFYIDGIVREIKIYFYSSNQEASKKGKKFISLVIDDFGYNIKDVKEFNELPIPITFAVLPGVEYSKKTAEMIDYNKNDLIVHIPFEPEDSTIKLSDNVIRLKDSKKVFYNKLDSFFDEFPKAVGANNHMGSLVMQNYDRMYWLLGYIKDKNLFFLDSRTTPKSIIGRVAADRKINILENNFYLDNNDDIEYIKGRLDLLMKMIINKKRMVVIGHYRPNTLKVLKQFLKENEKYFKENNINFIKISEYYKKNNQLKVNKNENIDNKKENISVEIKKNKK